MQDIQIYIEKAVRDLPMSDSAKKALVAAYAIQYYKSLLEFLMSTHTNKDFYKNMLDFFMKAASDLNDEEQKTMGEIMGEEKIHILNQIVVELQKGLPKEQADIIQKNIEVMRKNIT